MIACMMVQSCRRAARLGTAGVPASEMTGIWMDDQTNYPTVGKGGAGGGGGGRVDGPLESSFPSPPSPSGRGERGEGKVMDNGKEPRLNGKHWGPGLHHEYPSATGGKMTCLMVKDEPFSKANRELHGDASTKT